MASKFRWKVAQSAERKWWQNYLSGKDVNTYLSWKKEYWLSILAKCEITSIAKTATILDIGCGPAGIFMHFKEQIVTAVDPLIDQYEADLPHFKKDQYPNVTFVNESIETFSSQQTFDYIFCLNAINHVQDIELGYNRLVSMLSENGSLIVSIDAHNFSFFKHLFKLLPGDILHPHQYSLKEYEHFLTSRNIAMTRTIHVKKEFFFDHYIQIGKKK